MASFTLAQLRRLESFLTSLAPGRAIPLAVVASGAFTTLDVAVRHDVDDDLYRSLDFARWEHSVGVRASYYLLPSTDYWRKTAVVSDAALTLQALGHEVGLHNDVYHHRPDPDYALGALRAEADLMRSWGVNVVGCCDHGSGEPRNVDLWRKHERRPEEAGFLYEAYLLQRSTGVTYISDNGGVMQAPLARVEGKLTVLLVHPQHWPRRP